MAFAGCVCAMHVWCVSSSNSLYINRSVDFDDDTRNCGGKQTKRLLHRVITSVSTRQSFQHLHQ